MFATKKNLHSCHTFSLPRCSTNTVPYGSGVHYLTEDVDVGGHAEDHGQLVQQLHLVLERRVEEGGAHADQQEGEVAGRNPERKERDDVKRISSSQLMPFSHPISTLTFHDWCDLSHPDHFKARRRNFFP